MFLCLCAYPLLVFLDRCVHLFLLSVGFLFILEDFDLVLFALISSTFVYLLLVFEVFG